MVANIRLLAPLTHRQSTQFATIKSTIDAVKCSNTIQLSPKLNYSIPFNIFHNTTKRKELFSLKVTTFVISGSYNMS